MGWFKDFVIEMLNFIITSDTGMVNEYLTFTEAEGLIMTKIWNYFEVVGVSLTLIFFFIELSKIELEQRGEVTLQSLLAPFLKVVIAFMLIMSGKEIITSFFGFNNGIVEYIEANSLVVEEPPKTPSGSAITPESPSGGAIEALVDELGLLPLVMVSLASIILWLLSRLCYLVIAYQAISRKIEMILRAGFTPIAIGDVYRGADGNAVRYLKKFLALCLWGYAMLAIIQIGNFLAVQNMASCFGSVLKGTTLGVLTAVLSCLVFPLAEAGMISASKQLCNDVFGC